MIESDINAQGVDALIKKLHEDGVSSGREQAKKIIAEAEHKAEKILTKAKLAADKYLKEARLAADKYQAGGEQALNTAMRDAVLSMKSGLMAHFQADLKRLVSDSLSQPDMLEKMILEIVGSAKKSIGTEKHIDIILPVEVIGSQAIEERAEELQNGALTQYVLGLTQAMFQQGVTLHAANDFCSGIRVKLNDKHIILDLSEASITSLLMQHMQPRFRALLEGVIK
ncbi:MAG: hypothetical protein OFPII_11480 [Osedax symbiont Rs1]|nr:MAG: hypothetical protein OFPII_11480 [Osedax symbiont Rs1]